VREVGDGIEYAYGDEWRAVEEISLTLKLTSPEGLQEKTFTMYRTQHGPITHQLDDK
jgi:hypothetical protein